MLYKMKQLESISSSVSHDIYLLFTAHSPPRPILLTLTNASLQIKFCWHFYVFLAPVQPNKKCIIMTIQILYRSLSSNSILCEAKRVYVCSKWKIWSTNIWNKCSGCLANIRDNIVFPSINQRVYLGPFYVDKFVI